MRKIVADTFVSLDGVMEAPGGENNFKYGAWQMGYMDEEAGKIMTQSFASTFGLLLGRKTYEIFAGYWPTAPADDPVAKHLNSVPKYVVSQTLKEATWNNTHIIKGNLPAEIAKLKELPGPPGNLAVIGSGKLIQTLRQHNLVDEYVVWVHPILLGSGQRLFPEGLGPTKLKLCGARTTPSGIAILTYEPEKG